MKTPMVVGVIVVVVLVAVAGFYYVSTSSNGTTSTTTSAAGASGGVQIVSDNVTKNALSGTWQIALKNTGSVPISSITVYLLTPTRAFICSGASTSDGLFFRNCPATSGNPLPPNATVSGSSTGAGPESATVGTAYPVAVHLAFASGPPVWVNSTVTVRSG